MDQKTPTRWDRSISFEYLLLLQKGKPTANKDHTRELKEGQLRLVFSLLEGRKMSVKIGRTNKYHVLLD